MKIVFELEWPVVRKEFPGLPFIPAVGDNIHLRGVHKGIENFKVTRREFDMERNIITIFIKLP